MTIREINQLLGYCKVGLFLTMVFVALQIIITN